MAYSEEEQIEQLKRWWDENGKSVLGGILLAMVLLFGWQYWKTSTRNHVTAASTLYQQVMAAVEQHSDSLGQVSLPEETQEQLDTLRREFGDTGYGVLGALLQARLAAESGELGFAEEALREALKNNRSDTLQPVIELRLARLLLAENKPDEALAVIADSAEGVYEVDYQELKGDILLAKGEIEAARAAYQQAMARADALGVSRPILKMKALDLAQG